MIGIDSGDTAAAYVRPRNERRGRGRISRRAAGASSPSYSSVAASRVRRAAAWAYSTKRSRDVFMSTPEALVLDAGQAAADAEDHAAAGERCRAS